MLKAYTEFQELQEVLVGRCYDTKFLDSLDIPFTNKTKSLMTHLLDETEEDYQNLINTLNKLGVEVKRPSSSEYKKSYGSRFSGAYLMNPRDDQIVIDNKLILGQWHSPISKGFLDCLSEYSDSFLPDPVFRDIEGSSIVRLGEHIIVDSNEFANREKHAQRLKDYFEPLGYTIIYTKTHNYKFKNNLSHADSVFAILKPGLILHANENSDYSENIFPKWDLIKANKIKDTPFRTFLDKKRNYIKDCSYAFEDKKYNDEKWFNFLDTWFSDFMGYASETYFDVNCLVVNENTVIFSKENAEVFKKLEKHKITPIVCPFRHRLFWDGGIHCITLDLKRKGNRERYL